MPEDERPREKLAARGASALSDAELIAILLRTGVTGKNVVDHAREILRTAVVAAAYAVIVVHNHPSGDPSPSQADHSLTRRLAEAAELMQIKLLDHIIIGAQSNSGPGYFSFKEAGVL